MLKSHKVIEEEKEVTGTRKALIISVSNYSTNLRALDFCKNDGEEMYGLLKSLGYKISDNHKLVGQVRFDTIRDAIFDFFDNAHTKSEDTLLFYYSGHGIPDADGDVYLATSEVDPDAPYRRGFSFNELTRMMNKSSSTRIVSILDCCYSGAAKISKGLDKGGEEAAAKLGTAAINYKSADLQKNKGICLLAASQAAQEAYALKEADHSIFTYYLLEGLKGNEKSVDGSGNVTADTLGKYIHRAIVNLPPEKRPKQTPIRKVEVGDEIVLAQYPKLAEKPLVDISTTIFEGDKYLNNENYSKAVELFDEATKLNPKSYVAHSYKGYALLKLKKYNKAINSYNTALKINPKEIDALQNKGLALSKLSKHNEAIKCYNEALEVDPMNSKVWYYKGLALSQLSKYNEAIKCYNEAIRINPEYSDALRDKGLALENLAREVEEKEPASPLRTDISLLLDTGMQYFDNGDYDNAIKSFDKAMLLNPKNPILYNYKGDVFFKLKNYQEAIKWYDEALEINPKYLDVLKDRALSLSKLPNNDEAIRCYDEILRLEPNNLDAWIGMGVCLEILKKYKEAIECYEKVITIDPNNAVAHEKKKAILQIISEETKSRPQQPQQRSPVIGSLSSSRSSIQSISSSSQQQSPIHSHQPVATKDTLSSSSAIKEENEEKREEYYYPDTVKEEKKQQQKQLWISPKILILILIVGVIGSVLVFVIFGGVLPQNDIPIANAGNDITVNAGDTVTLDASNTNDPDGDSLIYSWKQTTGPSVEINEASAPIATFTAPSNLLSDVILGFQLTVSDNKNMTDKAEMNVNVKHTPPPNNTPVAKAGKDITVKEGTFITLDASNSQDSDEDTLEYSWNQIGGPAVTLDNANTAIATFTAPSGITADTILEFELIVKDNEGASSTDSVKITIKHTPPPNNTPIANAGNDITVNAGDTVTLNGSASTDLDGNIISYSWVQTRGPTVTLNNANKATPSFIASTNTSDDTVLTFDLTITDDKGITSTSDIVDIYIKGVPLESTTDGGMSENEDALSLYIEGTKYYNEGNYITALEYYNRALEIDPNNEIILTNKGDALNNLGRYTEAIEYYNRALEINPNYTALSNRGNMPGGPISGVITSPAPCSDKPGPNMEVLPRCS